MWRAFISAILYHRFCYSSVACSIIPLSAGAQEKLRGGIFAILLIETIITSLKVLD